MRIFCTSSSSSIRVLPSLTHALNLPQGAAYVDKCTQPPSGELITFVFCNVLSIALSPLISLYGNSVWTEDSLFALPNICSKNPPERFFAGTSASSNKNVKAFLNTTRMLSEWAMAYSLWDMRMLSRQENLLHVNSWQRSLSPLHLLEKILTEGPANFSHMEMGVCSEKVCCLRRWQRAMHT